MTTEKIKNLIPKDKFDTSSFGQLMALSDEEADVIIPDLLEWIQDMNWPVASHMIKVLTKHRDVTEKHLPDLLKPGQKDAEWKLHIIRNLLNEWPSCPDDDRVTAEIARIADHPTEEERMEEVDAAAREYLDAFA